MAPATTPPETPSTPAGQPRVMDLSRRVLLPIGAFASLVLGLLLMADPRSRAGAYAPFVLYGVGLGVLASLAFLRRPDASLPDPRAAPPPPRAHVEPSPGTGRTTIVEKGVRDSFRGSDRGSEWRVLSSPATPGDETWLSWLPRERRRLGSAGEGLVPGVIRSPGKAGTLAAFPVRSYFGGVRGAPGSVGGGPPRAVAPNPGSPGAAVSAAPPTPVAAAPEPIPLTQPRAPRTFSVEELDRLFPAPSDGRPVFLNEAPQRVGGPSCVSGWSRAPSPTAVVPKDVLLTEDGVPSAASGGAVDDGMVGPTLTAPLGLSGSASSRMEPGNDLAGESTNPIPPHLRGVGPLIRADAPATDARRARGSGAHRSICASCSKVVVDLRMSGPCPHCLRPICNDCLREALVTHGHGWCTDCSATAVAASVS